MQEPKKRKHSYVRDREQHTCHDQLARVMLDIAGQGWAISPCRHFSVGEKYVTAGYAFTATVTIPGFYYNGPWSITGIEITSQGFDWMHILNVDYIPAAVEAACIDGQFDDIVIDENDKEDLEFKDIIFEVWLYFKHTTLSSNPSWCLYNGELRYLFWEHNRINDWRGDPLIPRHGGQLVNLNELKNLQVPKIHFLMYYFGLEFGCLPQILMSIFFCQPGSTWIDNFMPNRNFVRKKTWPIDNAKEFVWDNLQ
jgi:hypothetical protein